MNGWAIGVDVGATKIASGLVDLTSGRIVHLETAASDCTNRSEEILRILTETIRELHSRGERDGMQPLAVGVGIPEIVSPSGEIVSDHRFPLLGRTLRLLPNAVIPVIVESDVRVAARAEAYFGGGRGRSLFLYVSVGSGVSSSIVIDGVPLVGAHGAALVLTSGITSEWCDGRVPPESFSVEEVASGFGIRTEYKRLKGENGVSTIDVLERWKRGEKTAVYVVERAALLLGQAMARAVDLVDPECIVIGGGFGTGAPEFHDAVVQHMRERIWLPAARKIPVLPAGLGAYSGVVGAALISALDNAGGSGIGTGADDGSNPMGACPSKNI